MKKPKLLFISAIPPMPQNSGGATRAYQTIIELKKYYQLDVVTFQTGADAEAKELISFLKSNTHNHYLLHLSQNYFLNSFLVDAQPYWFYPWYSSELPLLINQLHYQYQYEYILVDFTQLLFVTNYLPRDTVTIFSAHDVSAISFARRMSESRKIDQIIGQAIRLVEIYFYEKMNLPKYDLVLAMSQHDAQSLKKLYGIQNVLVVPNGIEQIIKMRPTTNKLMPPIKLGYIGSFNHPPNQYSVHYFASKIAPLLETAGLNYVFYLAGNNTDEQITMVLRSCGQEHLRHRFINLGVVKTPKHFFNKIDVQVASLFSGSGTRLKILEAAAHGKHTITTSLGAEGLPFANDTNLVTIAENGPEFAAAISDFAEHPKYAKPNATLEKLRWSHIFAELAAKINSIFG